MRKPGIALTTVILSMLVLSTIGASASFARGLSPIWYFDGRDDGRDFPTNGFFPGDFAADPASAPIGAAGLFGSTPTRSYPAQFTDGSQSDQNYCARRYRSYDPASGTFIGYDGARHRCQ